MVKKLNKYIKIDILYVREDFEFDETLNKCNKSCLLI